MNIIMATNTYTPKVGGVQRSIALFTEHYRRKGHRVMIIAPRQPGSPPDELDVIRVPAITNFNDTNYSLSLPVPGVVSHGMKDFVPDLVHAHHPFLLGDTALRLAAKFDVPLVYTHHTFFERYTHYVPGDSPEAKQFIKALTTEYANLADHVIAPSESVSDVLRRRGVVRPIAIIPTGIRCEKFERGDGARLRASVNLPQDAFVIGFISRIAPEKNTAFLSQAVGRFLQSEPRAWFFVVGSGPSEADIRRHFDQAGVGDRLAMFGTLEDQELINAYHALEVFAFASQTETQGLVLAEAMAAGVPVVALDASGVREVVIDRQNGRLLDSADILAFVKALRWIADLSEERRTAVQANARRKARGFDLTSCAEKALTLYRDLVRPDASRTQSLEGTWDLVLRRLKVEWALLVSKTRAAGEVISESQDS